MIRPLAIAAGVVAFVGLMAWMTLRDRGIECEVCAEFGGRRQCARAVGPDEDTAREGALTNACGTLGGSMAGELACRRQPPASESCRPAAAGAVR